MTPIRKLAIVAAVQFVVLLGVVGFKQYTVWTGTTVVLAAGPVDPRDPFRGDYVTLTYDISQIDPRELIGQQFAYGTVYVEVREDDAGTWRAVAIHDDRQHEFDDTVILKGRADYPRGELLYVRYGIEELFIPEGSGPSIPWERDITVGIKVDRFGNAVLRHLLVDGEKFDLKRQ